MQKDPKDFTSILENYLAGQATDEEKALLAEYFEYAGPFPQMQLSEPQLQQMQADLQVLMQKENGAIVGRPLYRRISTVRWAAAAAVLIILATSVWLLLLNRKEPAALAYTEIQTAKGETRLVKLPDSSVVTLNANSTLKYTTNFSEERNLSLSGEAYFSVTKDPSHPFRIQLTDSLQVEVLGTSFNVSSYRNSASASVMVTDGAVSVRQAATVLGILSKNRQMVYNRRSATAAIKTIQHPQDHSWMSGIWKYEAMSISDLMILLENQFGVTLINKTGKELHSRTDASLNFSKRQSPKEIVAVFCSVSSFSSNWINQHMVELR